MRAWQIILKDSPIILFFIPKFSAHYSSIILPLFSYSTMQPQQKFVVFLNLTL